jgi:GT2 family glycosyltransferase
LDTRKSTPSSEIEQRLAQIEASLKAAHAEIGKLCHEQVRSAQNWRALQDELRNHRKAQREIESVTARQEEEIRATARRLQDILDSRIWRTLAWLGGLLLPHRKAPIPEEGTATLQQNNDQTSGALRVQPNSSVYGTVRSAGSLSSVAKERTTAEWKELLRRTVEDCKRANSGQPRISVLTTTWNTPISLLAPSAVSILQQSSCDWEWCIVDDASVDVDFRQLVPALEQTSRIKIERLQRRQGVSAALNEALRLAAGEFVCFLDSGDLLAPDALRQCLASLNEGIDAVYTDHDCVTGQGTRIESVYKPDWSPEFFRATMYVGNLLCVRRETALKIGGFDARYDGVQDFEFMLRLSERTQRIGHLSAILYHLLQPRNAATNMDEDYIGELQSQAVRAHLKRLQLPSTAERESRPYRVRIVPLDLTNPPRVSILIPTKDAADLIGGCLRSIRDKTWYPNFETVCVDNETNDPRALELMKSYKVKQVLLHGSFNFSRANNVGVREADGEYLVFMNNDIEVITDRWIEEMLYYAQQNDVGAVGALLLYSDFTVQHAGVVLGCRGTADHVSRRAPADSDGYQGSLSCAREVSAVTAACMMVSRKKFEQAGGFLEEYCTAYQDVDLCLQLRSLGYRNIFNPHARFFHLESQTRGNYYDLGDRRLLLDRWGKTISSRDPYYNPNFDVEACDYTLIR